MIPSPRVSAFVLASLLVFASPYTYPQSAPPIVVEKPETNAEPAVFRFSGTITAKREADLSPRVAGLISVADAETGFAAEKGAVLVRLDDTLAKIELREQPRPKTPIQNAASTRL
jgi:multidrug efflux pump subunit AcrA (membrane-fusion protein)